MLVKEREKMGYEYSVAEASFELLFFQVMGWSKRYFQFLNFFVVDSKRQGDDSPYSEATVMVRVRGEDVHTAATGNGPVNALDRALRRARVLIESGDGRDRWTTVGVSHNIIEASWQALVDAVNYKLFKDDPQKWPTGARKDEPTPVP